MDVTLVITAVIAAGGSVAVAWLTSRATLKVQLVKIQKDNHLLYLWNRKLVDHIYKGYPPPPPAPPEGLFE